MYITLSNIQVDADASECVPLNPIIDNRDGDLEIVLCEILYYPAWVNISKELDNNKFLYADKTVVIPDVCTLNEQVFVPLMLNLAF
jgi:hypothetical protein